MTWKASRRRLWGLCGTLWMLGPWSLWSQGSEAVGLHASRWCVHGGLVQLGHEAVGTPWASAKVSLWGAGPDRTLEEWVVGFHAEDAQVWGRVAVHVGASHDVEDRTQLTWWVQAAVSSWPEVRVRSGHLRWEGVAQHATPWGSVRLTTHATLGPRPSLTLMSSDGRLLLPESPWGWTAWWCPEVEGVDIGLPALGWSQDGGWHVAWSPSRNGGFALQPWRPWRGRIRLHWSMPHGGLALGWQATLGGQENRAAATSAPITASRPMEHRGGMALQRGGHLGAWRGWWHWEKPKAVPQNHLL